MGTMKPKPQFKSRLNQKGGKPAGGKAGAVKKKKGRSYKDRIRGLERLLRKDDLDPRARKAKQAELEALKQAQLKHQQAEKERKFAQIYHKVKFFERVKIERRLQKLEKNAKQQELSEADQQLIKSLQDDLLYIKHYPKDQRYISLLRKAETPEAQKQLDESRDKMRALIRAKLAEVAMVTEADEGLGTAAKEGAPAPTDAAGAAQEDSEVDDFFLDDTVREVDDAPPEPSNSAEPHTAELKLINISSRRGESRSAQQASSSDREEEIKEEQEQEEEQDKEDILEKSSKRQKVSRLETNPWLIAPKNARQQLSNNLEAKGGLTAGGHNHESLKNAAHALDSGDDDDGVSEESADANQFSTDLDLEMFTSDEEAESDEVNAGHLPSGGAHNGTLEEEDADDDDDDAQRVGRSDRSMDDSDDVNESDEHNNDTTDVDEDAPSGDRHQAGEQAARSHARPVHSGQLDNGLKPLHMKQVGTHVGIGSGKGNKFLQQGTGMKPTSGQGEKLFNMKGRQEKPFNDKVQQQKLFIKGEQQEKPFNHRERQEKPFNDRERQERPFKSTERAAGKPGNRERVGMSKAWLGAADQTQDGPMRPQAGGKVSQPSRHVDDSRSGAGRGSQQPRDDRKKPSVKGKAVAQPLRTRAEGGRKRRKKRN